MKLSVIIQRLLQILLPIVIIFAAIKGFKHLKTLKKPPKSKKQQEIIPIAKVTSLSPGTHAPPIESFGTIRSFDETSLIAQTQAEITMISPNFRVGNKVKKGDVLVQLDDVEIKAELDTAKSNIIIAKSSLEEEHVRGKQAADDWKISGRKIESASRFVLRKPQLESAKANLLAAEAALTQAYETLSNTVIYAPYDGIVISRDISLGDVATTTTVLGRIIATHKAEVLLPLSRQQLTDWKKIQPTSPTITLSSPDAPNITWDATVKRTDPVISERDQVSYIIAEIDQPYAGDTPLSIGTFVNAIIPTYPIEHIFKIDESAIVNDAYVWVVTEEDTLIKIPATRLRNYKKQAYIRLETGDIEVPISIVTRPFTTFRVGQKVNKSTP